MAEQTILFTKEGFEALTNELQRLKSFERPKVIEEIAEARSHGDLSENAEYHAAREKQSFIEGRILELEGNLSRGTVADFSKGTPQDVRFGAFVTLKDEESGDSKTYRIVGDLEADISKSKISTSSPIAKAVMGKNKDDLIEVQAPKGIREYTIVDIRYDV